MPEIEKGIETRNLSFLSETIIPFVILKCIIKAINDMERGYCETSVVNLKHFHWSRGAIDQ